MGVRIAENRRPGKIIVDWEDASGRRHWKTFSKTREGERQARIFAGDLERKLARGEPMPDERILFGQVAQKWMTHVHASVEPQTAANYEAGLRLHLLPEFKDRPISRITRAVFKDFVETLLASGKLNRSTVRVKVVGVAANLFGWAMEPEQGYLSTNPAAKLGRPLKLTDKRKIVRAMTRDQLSEYISACKRVLNEDEALTLMLLFRCGLRMGEMQGLRWGDFLDDERAGLRIERQALKGGGIGPPKTSAGYRTVDVSTDLRDELRAAWIRRHEDRLKHGVPMSPWIACPEFTDPPAGTQVSRSRQRIAVANKKALASAGLTHFRPHDLRHTFCTLLLSQGEPAQYVQQQAGHSTISETVDTYGSWIQAESPGAMDRMADRTKAREKAEIREFLSEEKSSQGREKA